MATQRSTFETLNFSAPIGVRVRLVTIVVFAIVALLPFLPGIIGQAGGRPGASRFEWVGPAIALPIVAVALLLALVREYRLIGDELQVVRLGRVNRFSLAGLAQVEVNRAAMSHAWKKWGNDGLGAITGRFRSKQLGNFDALLTDVEHAVVLRWPERTLVISPDREAHFVESVRERIHLRG